MGREMGEIGDRDRLAADHGGKLLDFLMGQLEERLEQAELVHDLERRGVDGVAAEVAEEILVLLQHHDVDTGAGQQKSEHHAGGSASGNAAARGDGFGRHWFPTSQLRPSWPGHVPAIQSIPLHCEFVDARLKAGHDER